MYVLPVTCYLCRVAFSVFIFAVGLPFPCNQHGVTCWSRYMHRPRYLSVLPFLVTFSFYSFRVTCTVLPVFRVACLYYLFRVIFAVVCFNDSSTERSTKEWLNFSGSDVHCFSSNLKRFGGLTSRRRTMNATDWSKSCKDWSKNFLCEAGGCVDKSEVCNGIDNCDDGSDERPDYAHCQGQ